MTDDRDVAERALAALAVAGEGVAISWPPVAERIRAARELAGLTQAQVAERAGLPAVSEYWDLEFDDDEAFTCLSIAELHAVARVLSTTGARLLFAEEVPAPGAGHDFVTISQRLRQRLEAEHLTAGALGDEIGWDVRDVLDDPDALSGFNIVGLRDVCHAVGIDWVGAVVAADGSRRGHS